jgi:HSP20 family protein
MRGRQRKNKQENPMANLSFRRSPFQELFDVRRDFDNIFNRFLSAFPGNERERGSSPGSLANTFTPPVNAYIDKEGKQFRCEIALPGIDPQDVNVEARGNTLSIRGERKLSNQSKEADYVHSEMIYGSFERDIIMPEGVDTDKLTAEYRNGVLEITAPLSAAALPRRVEIKGAKAAAKQMNA